MSLAIGGVQVVDDGVNGETFTVTLSDHGGLLSATGTGPSGPGAGA